MKEIERYPLISVIIPVFNIEKYVEKCIYSIINQTYNNIEIIIVDDGSTDNSAKICDMLSKQHKNIKLLYKQNGGLSDARNFGLKYAHGKYICFIDGDDYIDKVMIETMFLSLKNSQADISIVDYKKVYPNSDKDSHVQSIEYKTEVLSTEESVRLLLEDKTYGNYAWNKMYKKELFDDIKYPYGRKMEDLGTTYKLFLKSKIIVYSHIKLYYYLQREGSILHTEDEKHILDKVILSIERYKCILRRYPKMKENKRFIYNLLMQEYHIIANKPQIEKDIKTILKKFNLKIFILLSLKNKIKYIFYSLNNRFYLKIRNSKG